MRHLYISSHSRIGYVSLFPEVAEHYKHLIILNGLSSIKASETLKKYANKLVEAREKLDLFYSPSHNDYLEGFAIRDKKIIVASSYLLENVTPKYPHLEVQFIHFSRAKKKHEEILYRHQVQQLISERNYQYHLAYKQFSEAKTFHEKKERIYLSAMNFRKADKVAEDLIKKLFADNEVKGRAVKTEKLFFGAATPRGAVNFIDKLTEGLEKRIIIKGRSGSGKSTLMNTVAKKAKELGMNVSYFYCAFDPSSVDMIIIDEIKTAILDGMTPHVIEPKRVGDEVIDMFELCIDPKIEKLRKVDIDDCEKNYSSRMKQGTRHLQKAHESQLVIDEYLSLSLDEEKFSQLEMEAYAKINELIS